MSRSLRAAIIGAGAQGWVHAFGYSRLPGVEVVAVSDVDSAAAAELAQSHGARAYRDATELLDAEGIDVVSICTPPAFHAGLVTEAVAAGASAIHTEKPMALRFDDAMRMRDLARASGVLLTVNHQRRLDPLQLAVRDAVSAGEIGEIIGVAGYCANLFDWGSHTLDLIRFHLGDRPALWVLAQIDVAARKRVYGALTETSGIVRIRFEGDLDALIVTGRDDGVLHPLGSNGITLQGSRGRIDVFGGAAVIHADGREPRVLRESVVAEFAAGMRGVDPAVLQDTAYAIADLISSLRGGSSPILDASRGLAAAELAFAAYESSMRRGRVWLPLDVWDNALERGLESGAWRPDREILTTH